MLHIIGTGLNDYKDITLRAFDIIKNADIIYQECYTSMQNVDYKDIELAINKKIVLADRKLVEETMEIVEQARNKSIVFLVCGTPLFATTHLDIIIRAKKLGVGINIIHNTSILNVKGCYGLYSYNYGKTVSIPYFTETCKYVSCYDNIWVNYKNNMHTLCLLDIKSDENRFMNATEAIEQLLYCESVRDMGMISHETEIFVVCRFGTDDELVKFGKIKDLMGIDFGRPLHSLIIPGKIDEIEREIINELFPINEREVI